MATLFDSNPKCVFRIAEECQRKITSRLSALRTSDRFDELFSVFQANLRINYQTLYKILEKQEKFETKVEEIFYFHSNIIISFPNN